MSNELIEGIPIWPPTCEHSCPFFARFKEPIRLTCDTPECAHDHGYVIGECRRLAPVGNPKGFAEWPGVEAGKWCGEHPAIRLAAAPSYDSDDSDLAPMMERFLRGMINMLELDGVLKPEHVAEVVQLGVGRLDDDEETDEGGTDDDEETDEGGTDDGS